MPLLPNNDIQCDSCPRTYPGLPDLVAGIKRAQSAGWGYWDGQTLGGGMQEHIICPHCRTDQKQKKIIKSAVENTALPGMETLHDQGASHNTGVQSR